MIIYIEKGRHLHEALADNGTPIAQRDGVWASDNEADHDAINAFILSYDPLPESKTDAVSRVTLEASRLSSAIYPFIDGEREQALGLYNFASDLYLSTVAGSREVLSGRLLQFKTIYDTAQVKIVEINAMTDWALVDAHDATVGW